MTRPVRLSGNPLKLGILSQVQPHWQAGRTLTDVMMRSLAACAKPERERVFLLTSEDWPDLPPNVEPLLVAPPDLSFGGKIRRLLLQSRGNRSPLLAEWAVRKRLGLVDVSNPIHVARLAELDVVLPLTKVMARDVAVRTVGWIPDFQHRFLPDLFSPEELTVRDREFEELASLSDRFILSSAAVCRDFSEFYPAHAHKARVASFPSMFVFKPPTGDPRASVAALGLPNRFALVVNQFWKHKNHVDLVDAIARCAAQGLRIPLVMVGALNDYRDPGTAAVSNVLQRIAASGVWDHVFVLGRVSLPELAGLLRCAAVVLQPSRFEGWNTTIQDARALGRPLVCSDLAVHREQAPDALGFFPCGRPDQLAKLLTTLWPSLTAGPHLDKEMPALVAASRVAATYGDLLLDVCRDAAGRSRG